MATKAHRYPLAAVLPQSEDWLPSQRTRQIRRNQAWREECCKNVLPLIRARPLNDRTLQRYWYRGEASWAGRHSQKKFLEYLGTNPLVRTLSLGSYLTSDAPPTGQTFAPNVLLRVSRQRRVRRIAWTPGRKNDSSVGSVDMAEGSQQVVTWRGS